MATPTTKAWMQRNKLKAVTVYFSDVVFARVQAAAKADGRSKGNWVHNIVIEHFKRRAGRP
jgi:hypothetical protein